MRIIPPIYTPMTLAAATARLAASAGCAEAARRYSRDAAHHYFAPERARENEREVAACHCFNCRGCGSWMHDAVWS